MAASPLDIFPWSGILRGSTQPKFDARNYVETGTDFLIGTPTPSIMNIDAAGTTQAGAMPLVYQVNIITGGSGGVILVAGNPDTKIVNRSGATINVYPPLGGQIENLGANNPGSVVNGGAVHFLSPDDVQWSAT